MGGFGWWWKLPQLRRSPVYIQPEAREIFAKLQNQIGQKNYLKHLFAFLDSLSQIFVLLLPVFHLKPIVHSFKIWTFSFLFVLWWESYLSLKTPFPPFYQYPTETIWKPQIMIPFMSLDLSRLRCFVFWKCLNAMKRPYSLLRRIKRLDGRGDVSDWQRSGNIGQRYIIYIILANVSNWRRAERTSTSEDVGLLRHLKILAFVCFSWMLGLVQNV